MSKQLLAIEMTDEQMVGVRSAAEREGLTSEAFVGELLEHFLTDDRALQATLAEADRDISAGRTVAHEDVVSHFESRLTATSASKAA